LTHTVHDEVLPPREYFYIDLAMRAELSGCERKSTIRYCSFDIGMYRRPRRVTDG